MVNSLVDQWLIYPYGRKKNQRRTGLLECRKSSIPVDEEDTRQTMAHYPHEP